MKNFAQLIKDLGLNETASRDAQQAFVRHLQRSAANSGQNIVSITARKQTPKPEPEDAQLSFADEILNPPLNKKI